LRGPITSLMGLAWLGKNDLDRVNTFTYFDKISIECRHMLRILKKLHDSNVIFKGERSNSAINWDCFFAQIYDDLKMNGFYGLAKIMTDINVGNNVVIDEVLLKAIVYNLIENSIIFRRNNDAFVKVSVNLNCDMLVIVVYDNGNGIPDFIANNIYDMFYRGSELSIGNGLGLYFVKRATEILKGELQFASKVNGYTSFTVRLPIDSLNE